MVDLVITAANVIPGANAEKGTGVAGETIIAGKVIYPDPVTRKLRLADSNSPAPSATQPLAIALHGASDGQPLTWQKGGDINLGAALTVGTIYCLSETPGGIQPSADLSAGEFVTVLGVATAANNLKMGILVSGAAVP
jgi:hypothetical protein